ncbi:unnamed protein product [Diplocarpon coronariae]
MRAFPKAFYRPNFSHSALLLSVLHSTLLHSSPLRQLRICTLHHITSQLPYFSSKPHLPFPTELHQTVARMSGRPSVFTSQDYISDHIWKASVN